MAIRLGGGAEFDLIRRFLASRGAERGPHVVVGPGDDAAVVDAGPLAISCDLSVESIHFRRDWLSPEEIGWRAAAGALSDLAAMAASPVGMLVALAAPAADVPAFAERVMAGAAAAGDDVGAPLIGGDVTRSGGPLALDVIVVGRAGAPLLRSGAAAGEEVWVTGRLGGAAAAVRALLDGRQPDPAARERLARPRPRTREALWLVERARLGAGIDLSDGIAGDAGHLAAASGVAIELEEDALPVDVGAGADLDLALGGGDDYELCVTAAPGVLEPVRDAFEEAFGVPLTRVGRVVDVDGDATVRVRGSNGTLRPVSRGGFVHFGETT